MLSAASDPRLPRTRDRAAAGPIESLGGAHVAQLGRALQPTMRRISRRRRIRLVREFRGQHVGSRALAVLGGRLQQRVRAPAIGRGAHAVEIHEAEQILSVGVAGVAGGVEQLDCFVELQRTQRRARRLERILGLDSASAVRLPRTG